MIDTDCIAFLQWALPRLHLSWPGFRRVRRQVCRRIDHRRRELGLADVAAYRTRVEATPAEWAVLDEMCRITISRFARDHAVWTELAAHVLPHLLREASLAGRGAVHAWSVGCGAGEEPFTLAIAWELALAPDVPELPLEVLATDIDEVQLRRAGAARFPPGALRELPDEWRRLAFEEADGELTLRDRFRARVRFSRHDARAVPPSGPFDLVLCRNLAFTYFDEPVQRQVAASLRGVLRTGGALVVGIHEQVPSGVAGFTPSSRCIYQAVPAQPLHPVEPPPATSKSW
jgi:chemotaxis protein methyltransferase CheR